jgi:hypothetical protein
VPHGKFSGIGINSANVLHYGRGYEHYTRTRRGVNPESANQMCKLVVQGRAMAIVSPQDVLRITVEKEDIQYVYGRFNLTYY